MDEGSERTTVVNTRRDCIPLYDGFNETIEIGTVKLEPFVEDSLNESLLIFDRIVSCPDLSTVETDMPCAYKDEIEIGKEKVEPANDGNYPEFEQVFLSNNNNQQDQPQTSSIVKQGFSTESSRAYSESSSESWENYRENHYHNEAKLSSTEQTRTYCQQICLTCGKTIVSKYMNRHLLRHLRPTRFPCGICTESFSTRSSVYRHKRRKHQSCKDIRYKEKGPFWCELCKKCFKHRWFRDNHKAIVHPFSDTQPAKHSIAKCK